MELDSNDSKDNDPEDIIDKINSSLITVKEDSKDSKININNILSVFCEEQMEVDEELDLRLIKINIIFKKIEIWWRLCNYKNFIKSEIYLCL